MKPCGVEREAQNVIITEEITETERVRHERRRESVAAFGGSSLREVVWRRRNVRKTGRE